MYISDTIGPHLGPTCEHSREQKKLAATEEILLMLTEEILLMLTGTIYGSAASL